MAIILDADVILRGDKGAFGGGGQAEGGQTGSFPYSESLQSLSVKQMTENVRSVPEFPVPEFPQQK